MTSNERWIPTRTNRNYEVSNLGNVRNTKTGKVLKPTLNKPNGWYRVSLGGKREYVHRIVVESFNGCDLKGVYIHHKDGNKTNNAITNLEPKNWDKFTERL